MGKVWIISGTTHSHPKEKFFGLNLPPTAVDSRVSYFPNKLWLVISPPLGRSSDPPIMGWGWVFLAWKDSIKLKWKIQKQEGRRGGDSDIKKSYCIVKIIFNLLFNLHIDIIYQAKWCELPERTVLVITSVKGAQVHVESFTWICFDFK